MAPDVQLDNVDLIVNRNSLRKLLNFAAGKRQEPFRMTIHMVKNTLFISRNERNARLMIRGVYDSGYGHNFERAFTKPAHDLDHSSSHHRVVQYRLGHLKCVVQFEVDAYYEGDIESSTVVNTGELVEDLAASMTQLTIDKPRPDSLEKGATNVHQKGRFISSSSLAEVKIRKAASISEAIPQLWFGRTPYLLTGRHVQGVVHSVRCSHVEPKFRNWEAANQGKLRKLVNLLAELARIASEMRGGTAILVCQSRGAPLQVFEVKKETTVLPASIIAKHWSQVAEKD